MACQRGLTSSLWGTACGQPRVTSFSSLARFVSPGEKQRPLRLLVFARKRSGFAEILFNRRLEEKEKILQRANRLLLTRVTVSSRLPVSNHIPRPPYVNSSRVPDFSKVPQVQDAHGIECMRASGRLAAEILNYAGTLVKGQSKRWPCRNGLTTGDASGLRSEAGITARCPSASPYRWIQVAYRAEYLTSNCGQSFSALKLHSAAFSTQRNKQETTRRDLAAQDEDPFDPLTDRIPAKPVTFAEGASYTVAIFLGFAVAAAAAYAVFKELIFEPKEYKVFNKALDRVQNDNQVTVRIGLPVTGYGQDSRNRAARQRIPHRTWADEDGVERIEVQFFVRGPHGVGRVHSEMFRDKEDKQWKFTYLIVDILSPSPTRIMLESYVPT